jgi:hypothetical protein
MCVIVTQNLIVKLLGLLLEDGSFEGKGEVAPNILLLFSVVVLSGSKLMCLVDINLYLY